MDFLQSFLVVPFYLFSISETYVGEVVNDGVPHFPGLLGGRQEVVVGMDWAVHGEQVLVGKHLIMLMDREDVGLLVEMSGGRHLYTTSSYSQGSILCRFQFIPVGFTQRWSPDSCSIVYY